METENRFAIEAYKYFDLGRCDAWRWWWSEVEPWIGGYVNPQVFQEWRTEGRLVTDEEARNGDCRRTRRGGIGDTPKSGDPNPGWRDPPMYPHGRNPDCGDGDQHSKYTIPGWGMYFTVHRVSG